MSARVFTARLERKKWHAALCHHGHMNCWDGHKLVYRENTGHLETRSKTSETSLQSTPTGNTTIHLIYHIPHLINHIWFSQHHSKDWEGIKSHLSGVSGRLEKDLRGIHIWYTDHLWTETGVSILLHMQTPATTLLKICTQVLWWQFHHLHDNWVTPPAEEAYIFCILLCQCSLWCYAITMYRICCIHRL